jgi:uncharacterized protein
MIARQNALKFITPFIDKPIIKVVTGIRRCGKSTFQMQIMDLLKEKGITEKNIVYINKEIHAFDEINDYQKLHKYVSSKAQKRKGKIYLFIDEVQEIDKWEKAVVSFLAEKKYDIYITGSNAHMLSSDLATLITGRYVEFRMYPFSFSEFSESVMQNSKTKDKDSIFELYLRYGGFPAIHHFGWDETAIGQYLHSLYNTILLKDIVVRYSIRDAGMFEKIMEFLISNLGNITSANKISEFVKSQHRKISVETVQNYIDYATGALLMNKIKRYDIKGKRLLESHEKYYLSDQGFHFSQIGYKKDFLPGLLENIVLVELLSRGYKVNVGKLAVKEIDFIAEKGSQKLYIQVCTGLLRDDVTEREYGAFSEINDHFPKYVISLDKGFETDRNGIRWKNIIDFLHEKDTWA